MPVCIQANAINGLVAVLRHPEANLRSLAHASFVLKRLTAAKAQSRASFVLCDGPAALMPILQRREEPKPNGAKAGSHILEKAIQ